MPMPPWEWSMVGPAAVGKPVPEGRGLSPEKTARFGMAVVAAGRYGPTLAEVAATDAATAGRSGSGRSTEGW